MAERIRLGNAALARVVEWQVDRLSHELFPQTPAEAWREVAPEYTPTFWNDAGWRIALQTWVVDVDGLTVLVDTGAGNDRNRPAMPPLDHLNTDFLGSLRARALSATPSTSSSTRTSTPITWAGTQCESATPGCRRFPTPATSCRKPTTGTSTRTTPHGVPRLARGRRRATSGLATMFEDSVFPVEEQIELWSEDQRLSESLRLRPAPGHTPGTSVLWLDAGMPAVFVGDLTHCPVQLHRPTDPCAFDEDFAAAAMTRKRVLTEASRRRAAVVPAHYPGHGGATVVARGDAFMVDDWLELPPI